MEKEFRESQKFTQWVTLPILLFGTVFFVWRFILTPTTSTGISAFLNLLATGFFYKITLKTEINKQEIKMSLFPFIKKKVSWADVKTAKTIDYGFVGGWGIRFWTQHGTIYNMRGSKGFLIELKNGKKFVIGTQKEEELRLFIATLNE